MRRSIVAPALVSAAFGFVALPAATPATATPLPPLAIGVCDVGGKLEAALGERFGGLWADRATQKLRVGIISREDEAAARAAVAACDTQDAANGIPAQHLQGLGASYVVVQTPYPAVKRAQQALTDWWASSSGTPSRRTIVSHGIGLGPGDANVDGYVGMVVRVTLHIEITDEDAALVEAATARIADEHGVTILIDEQRTGYPVALAGDPGPLPPKPKIPSPGPATEKPATTAPPAILGRSTASRRTVLSTRKLPVRLQVAAAGTYRLTVRTADRRRTVIARGVARPKRAGQLTVRTTLTKAGRAQLRKAGRTAVTLSVRQTGQKTVTKRIVVR